MKISFLGLGVMGANMARNIMKKNDGQLVVWNRTRSKCDPLEQEGAAVAGSPADAAKRTEIICLCVSDTPDVESVAFGPEGIEKGLSEGKIVIDFSTISDKATEDFAERARKHGASWIDAPVSGGDVGAREGSLTVMAGGDEDAFKKVLPILEMVGGKIRHMGRSGNGQRTKLANQIAVAGAVAAMAEALNFAKEKNMDAQEVLEVISAGAAGSWSLSNYGPRVLKEDFSPGFAARLKAKDLRLVLEALQGTNADYTVVRHMSDYYEKMLEKEMGDQGSHAVIKLKGWE